MKHLIILSLCIISSISFAQERFSDELLSNPKKNGKVVENSFKIEEIHEYKPDTISKVNLQNGLRSSVYINPESWTKIKDDVEVISVTVVFSKYPIRKDGYSMNHKLLFNRLKNLFKIDPMLNDSLIDWKIVLHTNCKNDDQVDSLFHGVVIEYLKEDPLITPIAPTVDSTGNLSSTDAVESVTSFIDLPEDVLKELDKYEIDGKMKVLIKYFEKVLADTTTVEVTEELLVNYQLVVEDFISRYQIGMDSTVFKVLDRNDDWENILIVSDWTGSMYPYGAQALLWHTLHFQTSGISYFTLFNDGDHKWTSQKYIGETGGIYFEEADNINKLIHLYQLVMLNGGGGDGPENDIEGVLEGMEHFPDHSEIVLIVDNNSCVRDIVLLEKIGKPVRVIICGYDMTGKVNPQYVKIAKETGGSLHTIEHDIYDLQLKMNLKGDIKEIVDYDLNIGTSFFCDRARAYYPPSYYTGRKYRDLDSARRDKRLVRHVDLSNQSLNKIPRKVKKLKYLETLNLSNNEISILNKPLYKLTYLKTLDLSHNQLTTIPYELKDLNYLTWLDLSYNQIDSITTLPRIKQLTYLDLSGNGFSYLPINIYYRNLQVLYLDNNNIQKLPSSIGRLKKLQELSVSGNALTEVPRKICRLRKLKLLNLSDNYLTELPACIINMVNLETLILSGNNFSAEYIAQLRELMPHTNIIFQ